MRPQTCLRAMRTAWLSLLPFDSRRYSSPGESGDTGCRVQALRRGLVLVLVLLLLPLARGWAQYGQYAPVQQPGYGQTQPYPQQPYAQQPYSAPDQGYPQQDYGQQQAPAQPLSAEQLEELVAPIALYPDTLVAQMLAAATYPAQVVGADHWLQAQGYASPEQIAAGADAQAWDPSVKALTAFPQVLAQMDHNQQWTTDLGNAYYNQPQDVLETVQVLRQRAQSAGTLEDTAQQAVSYNQGYIQLAPVNSQVVYVPAYNPWDVYGEPVTPYRGFSLLGSLESLAGSAPVKFGLGMAMSAFSHTGFGWAGWALDWLTRSVLFHQSNYTSHSTTVAHWGSPHNGQRDSYNRQQSGYGWRGNGYNGPQAFGRPPVRNPESRAENRPFATNRPPDNRNYVRPALPAYSRPEAPITMPIRPQPYARPGYGFYGRSPQTYASPQQTWRAPAPIPQRGEFGQRSYFGDRSYPAPAIRGFTEPRVKPEHSGGFHLFGRHDGERSYGGSRAPKSFGGGREFKEHSHGGGHSGGGGHFGGHHGGGHHR